MSDRLQNYVEAEDFRAKRPSLRVAKMLLRDLYGERKLFVAGFLFILLGTAAQLYEPKLFGRAIDEAIVPKDLALLRSFVFAYVGVTTVRVLSLVSQSYLFEKLAEAMMQKLRMRLFLSMQSFPLRTYDKTPVGRMITRLTNDTSAMSDMFSAGFVTMTGNIFFIVGSVVSILSIDWRVGLVGLSVLPVLVFASVRFSTQLLHLYRTARMKISALNAFLAENILGMKIVNLFNRQTEHRARFDEVNEAYAQAQASSIRVYAYFQPLITWCSGLGVALVLAFGGRAILGAGEGGAFGSTMRPGELVAMITYFLALFQPIREVVDRWTIFLSGMTSAERVYGVMEWETELSLDEQTRAIPAGRMFRGEIEFENVWFAYEDAAPGADGATAPNWVLKDFSLRIPAGTKVGIVGHTGAGKTTLIGLLLRFYDAQKGVVRLDGRDIRGIPKRELRAHFGLIQQDVFLFSGKIEDNVHLFSKEGISAGGRAALERLGFKQDLARELDERGSNLSMGERQMIAFTRALDSDPDLWILDEATANVDSESEKRLGALLDEASAGKTLLMIAHRLATIRRSDQIVVLHRGVLVEKGTHEELLRSDGYYARLYRYQASVERTERAGESLEPSVIR